jgi:O-antigen/teichoic acid export membrane protein
MSMRSANSLLSNLFYLGGARAAVMAMNLVATSHLAHALGADNFGINSFAASYLAYFLIVVDLGFDTFLTREVAFDDARREALVGTVLSVRLLLALLLSLVLAASLRFLHLSPLGELVVLIQGIGLVTAAIGLTSVYQGMQRMRVVAGREFLASLGNMVAVLCFVRGPQDLVAAACITAGTQLFVNLALVTQYVMDFGIPRLRLPGAEALHELKRATTYFWSMVMITITYNTHVVLLGLMRGDREVGLFSAGWKLFIFSIAIPNLIAALFMPRLAATAANVGERERAAELLLRAILVCSVPITLLGMAAAPQILEILFGPDYLPAAGALRLLLMNSLAVAISIGLATELTALGRQGELLRIVTIGAFAGIVLNLVLIPPYGARGAALATLTDEVIIVLMLMRGRIGLPRQLGFGARCLLAAIPAAIAMYAVISCVTFRGGHFVVLAVGAGGAGLVYLLALAVMQVSILRLVRDLRQLR